MSIYTRIPSHFNNKYALSTGYAYQSQGLSDALDVFCEIIGITPAQLGMWQGAYNPHEPKASANTHRFANAADLVLPSADKIDEWIKTLSYIGVVGWHRDATYAHGGFSTPHIHCFALFQMNKKYVGSGIIAQQAEFLRGENGLANHAKDYHASLRPDLKAVHFLGKAPNRNAVVTEDTHNYKQPGKLAIHQDKVRKKGFKITTAVGIVRVWKLDSHGNTIKGSSVDMLVTQGLRFYDLKKVKWA